MKAATANWFENDVVRMEIKDGILHAHYKAGTRLSLEIVKDILKARYELCRGNEYPFMIYNGGSLSMDRDARLYFSSAEGTRGIKAAAFVESSVFSRMLVNFFLKLTKPKVKSKAFSDPEEAMAWLKESA